MSGGGRLECGNRNIGMCCVVKVFMWVILGYRLVDTRKGYVGNKGRIRVGKNIFDENNVSLKEQLFIK